jgi:hypothetical protein
MTDPKARRYGTTVQEFPWPGNGTPQSWANGRHTGDSSKTILLATTRFQFGERFEPDIPYDYEDFWRCYRLMQMVPATADIQKVAEVYAFWKPMADAWPELTKLFENTLQAQMDADVAYDHRLNSGVTNLESRDVKEAFDAFKARIVVARQECMALMPKDEDVFAVGMGG